MTRCEHCGQSLLAYAHMRMQRNELLAAAKRVRQAAKSRVHVTDFCDALNALDAAIERAEKEA